MRSNQKEAVQGTETAVGLRPVGRYPDNAFFGDLSGFRPPLETESRTFWWTFLCKSKIVYMPLLSRSY